MDLSTFRRYAYGVTGRKRVNALVGSAVGASAEQQKSPHELLIQPGDLRRVNQRLQAARPADSFRLHVVIKRTHTCKVAGQDDGAVDMIVYDNTPIADQFDKPVGPP